MTAPATDAFALRHIGPRPEDRDRMLHALGVPTLVAGAAMLYFVGFNGYLNRILVDLNIIDIPIYWQQPGWRGIVSVALADIWKSLPMVVSKSLTFM